jgi:hypothetical protein
MHVNLYAARGFCPKEEAESATDCTIKCMPGTRTAVTEQLWIFLTAPVQSTCFEQNLLQISEPVVILKGIFSVLKTCQGGNNCIYQLPEMLPTPIKKCHQLNI